jgi:hypothetical protein
MTMSLLRFAAPLVLLILGPVFAEEKKAEVTTVTIMDLDRNPEKFHGKMVRIAGVLESTPRTGVGTSRYFFRLVGADGFHIHGTVKPEGVKGDRVRITGKFTWKNNSFVTHRLAVEPPHGKVEKVPAKKEEKKDEPAKVSIEDLGKDRRKHFGKIVQVEVSVPYAPVATKKGGGTFWVEVGEKHLVHLLFQGKPDVAPGDRIRVTGLFDFRAPTFARLRIDTTVPGGQVEKLSPKKE